MKKILIAFALVILVVALLPIVGNSVAQKILQERVELLSQNGLEISNETTQSTYLKTKKHYEFLVADTSLFIKYLNNYSDAQLPPYVDSLIDAVRVGVDVEYSNVPLSSNIEIDIYPLSVSTTMMSELKKDDVDFYIYVQNLLNTKAVLYHINYSVSSMKFDGFIKNIDEEYVFNNGTKLNIKILDAFFNGDGLLIAPQNLHTKISNITFKASTLSDSLAFVLDDMQTSSTFESLSTYASSTSVKNFSLLIHEKVSGKTEVHIQDMKMNLSTNTQGKKAEFYSKSSIKKLKISSLVSHIVMSDFNYDISLDGVDKDAYEEFTKLTSHAKELQSSVTKMLSRGLTINIADFSLDKIGIEDKQAVDGFSIMAKMTLKEDLNLASKLTTSPMAWTQNMTLSSSLKFSKEFYTLLIQEIPLLGLATSIAKEDANKLVFDITLNNDKLIINDKALN